MNPIIFSYIYFLEEEEKGLFTFEFIFLYNVISSLPLPLVKQTLKLKSLLTEKLL